MSLDFQLTDIKDWKTACYIAVNDSEDRLTPILEILIWQTLSLDLGAIKADNIDEWVWRIAFLREAGFPPTGRRSDRTPWWPSADELRTFIGLKTNVGTVSRGKWLKRRMEILVHETDAAVKRLKQEELEAAKIAEPA